MMNQNMVNEGCEPVRAQGLADVARRVSALAYETNAMVYAVHACLLDALPEDTGRKCEPTNLKEELFIQADVLEDALTVLRVMLKEFGL